jgi:hypothetical protein
MAELILPITFQGKALDNTTRFNKSIVDIPRQLSIFIAR